MQPAKRAFSETSGGFNIIEPFSKIRRTDFKVADFKVADLCNAENACKLSEEKFDTVELYNAHIDDCIENTKYTEKAILSLLDKFRFSQVENEAVKERELIQAIRDGAFRDNMSDKRVRKNGKDFYRCTGPCCSQDEKGYRLLKKEEFSVNNSDKKHGIQTYCKPCVKVNRAKTTRECCCCKKHKKKEDFPENVRQRRGYVRCTDCENLFQQGKKVCIGMHHRGKALPLSTTKFQYSVCMVCYNGARNLDIKKCFEQMLEHMKDGRHKCTITDYKFLVYLFVKQRFRCALTLFFMDWRIGSGKYHMSIDRINDKIGYTEDNVRLVISICNTKGKFTKDKINYLIKNRLTPVLNARYIKAKRGHYIHEAPSKQYVMNSFDEWNAIQQGNASYLALNEREQELWKLLYDAYHAPYGTQSTNKVRQAINMKIGRCTATDKERNSKTKLSVEGVIGLIWCQRGICNISGMPFKIVMGKRIHWRWSIERCDNDGLHVLGNVMIICWEFNCGDQTKDTHKFNQLGDPEQWLRRDVYELWPETKKQDFDDENE